MFMPGCRRGIFDFHPQKNLRDFRHDGAKDWLTYNKPIDDPLHELVTLFY